MGAASMPLQLPSMSIQIYKEHMCIEVYITSIIRIYLELGTHGSNRLFCTHLYMMKAHVVTYPQLPYKPPSSFRSEVLVHKHILMSSEVRYMMLLL